MKEYWPQRNLEYPEKREKAYIKKYVQIHNSTQLETNVQPVVYQCNAIWKISALGNMYKQTNVRYLVGNAYSYHL